MIRGYIRRLVREEIAAAQAEVAANTARMASMISRWENAERASLGDSGMASPQAADVAQEAFSASAKQSLRSARQ